MCGSSRASKNSAIGSSARFNAGGGGGVRCRIMARRKTASAVHPESARHRNGLPALKPLRVLVAGEVILDRYIWGDVSRISPEAPIPILRVQRREEKPGNAGFVMANLRALGADVSALSVVGVGSQRQPAARDFRRSRNRYSLDSDRSRPPHYRQGSDARFCAGGPSRDPATAARRRGRSASAQASRASAS